MATNSNRVREQVQKWRDDLINLNRRNRLLFFKHTKTSSIQISAPSCDDILSLLGSRPGRLEFYEPVGRTDGVSTQPMFVRPPAKNEAVCQVWRGSAAEGELRDATSADLTKILRNLDRQARAEFMDRGLQSLYLGLGLLEWVDPKLPDETNTGPLLLVPVELERTGPGDPYRLVRAQDDIVLNPALQLKLENDFGVSLPSIDDEECRCDEYFDRVRAAISRQPQWEVRDVTVLARFSFLKEVMYRDLLDHEAEICEHPLVKALASPVGSRSDFDFDPVADDDLDAVAVDSALLSIRDADATQRACIWAAREGRTFVMDGPPGTGKSQTIANMIAELIGNGRSVLFVSEKAAALEVVFSRLRECGLDEYVLQLHSHKATRREVARQLSASVNKRPRMDGQLSDSEVSDLHKKRKQLSDYAAAMNEVRDPLGMNLFDVIGRAAGLGSVPRPAVRAEVDTGLSATQLARILSAANDLLRSWGPVERADSFVWRDLTIKTIDAAHRAEIAELLDSMLTRNSNVELILEESRDSLQGWDPGRGATALKSVGELVLAVAQARDCDPLWLSHERFSDLVEAVEELQNLQTECASKLAEVQTRIGSAIDRDAAVELSREFRAVCSLTDAAAGWRPGDDWSRGNTSGAVDVCRQIEEKLREDVTPLLRELVGAIGISGWEKATLADANDLAELLGIAERPERPEADWLSLSRLSELKAAQPVLASLVMSMREKRAKVNSIYRPEVLECDADALSQRFTQVHVGIGRVSLSYFKDRKTLAGLCRTGKFSQAAVESLPVVVELQKLSSDLAAFERQQGGLVGSYYHGEETDLERLDRAIQLADSALALVERRIGLSRALGTIALRADADSGALLSARHLRTAIQFIRDRALSLGMEAESVFGLSIEEAVVRFERVEEAAIAWECLAGHYPDGARTSEMIASAGAATAVEASVAEESTRRPRLGGIIGTSYLGLETDAEALFGRMQTASGVRKALGTSVPIAVGTRVLSQSLDIEAIQSAISAWTLLEDQLLGMFEDEQAADLRQRLDADCAEATQLIMLMAGSLDDVDEWISFVDSRRRLRELGLEATADACVAQSVAQRDVAKVVERVVLETWIDAVVESDKTRLSPLRAKDRQALRAEYADLDRRLVRAAAGRVMSACNARRPSKNVGAVGIILREGEKKTRHMPIRTLLEKTKAEAQAIKPCFMMSPLSVSQFLPSDLRFDVVLFDEASQIRPHDAVNCVYRGSQHIIAGDQQQLPPTSFFDEARDDGDDVWNEEDLETFESVLDVAKSCASIPSLPLRWHYRSRHEDLITYSNVSFYDSNLISFPAPHMKSPTLGIGFNKAEGVYRRGRGTPNDNPVEAGAVADMVSHYAKNYPGLTLGVVAFSSAQEEAIENAIEQLRVEDPTLPDGYFDTERLDGFFVKNLETVQGDERDVIILSVGYGRDEAGKILMNFGPINKAGGYRRLNVAVTRARMRLEVVASITGADISASSENDGVRHMKRYLEYAERGPSVLTAGDARSLGGVESPFEAEVERVMRSWGYDVVTQVGSAGYRIDLALVHPDQPGRLCLAIECDGAAYHTSKVARDRDRLRDEVLRGLGWRIHRIWGTAWFRQRELAEKELRAAIDNAIADCDLAMYVAPEVQTAEREPIVTTEMVELDSDFQKDHWVTDYRVQIPSISAMDRRIPMGDRSASPIMKRELPGIVQVEGPVHRDVALERLKEAWQTKRAGHNIAEEFDSALRSCVKAGLVECDSAGFLWVPGERAIAKARRPVPGDSRTRRRCGHICDHEFDLVIGEILFDVSSIGEAQLARTVADVFGWERVGSEIKAKIEAATTRVLERNPQFEDRILPDAEIPRVQSASHRRPTVSRPQSSVVAPPAAKAVAVKSNARCCVCGTGFGDRSKPTQIIFFDVDSQRSDIAHQNCAERLRSGRASKSGYRWDANRSGLVPRGGGSSTSARTPGPKAVGWDSDSNTPIIG